VALLRRCRLRSRVRAAREAQAARFPLTEALWRQWIEDEVDAAERCVLAAFRARRRQQRHLLARPNPRDVACSAEDVDAIEALYERALRDYLSVPLWTSYIEARKRALPGCTPLLFRLSLR
jgi:hypothetical protein